MNERERAEDRGEDQLGLDTGDKPSMGDAEFVEGQVRSFLGELVAIRAGYNADDGSDSVEALNTLVNMWAEKLSAANPGIIQTMTMEAQAVFLISKGFANVHRPLQEAMQALIAHAAKEFVDTMVAHEGELSDEDAKFRVDAQVEDTVALIMGVENAADEEG